MNRGELNPTEPHPVAQSALEYVVNFAADMKKASILMESFSSCAIEGNRLGEICSETLNRVIMNQPVSDRYILGLAWFIRNMEDEE